MENLTEQEFSAVITVLVSVIIDHDDPVVQHDSALSGRAYYNELLQTSSRARFHDIARMDRDVFLSLLHIVTEEGGLRDSEDISAGEKLMNLINALYGWTNRQMHERWQHSGSTLSTFLHEAIKAVVRCKHIFFSQPEDMSRDDPKFYPYFKDCIGAPDGTHIPAVLPTDIVAPFRNRKGFVSQNVLGVVNFDMTFVYVLVGWEGSGHDGTIFNDAKTKGLPIQAGKYWLGDAGYALSRYVLTPYRGVRYHLREWSGDAARPMNKEELFNLRHSSLRNVIERTFGVLKKRFPLLSAMHSYAFETQCHLVLCAVMLHNFIRANSIYEDPFDIDDDEAGQDNDDNVPAVQADGAMSARELNAWRDGIATSMWNDYQVLLARRGEGR